MSFTQKIVMVWPWCFSNFPKICLGILWHNFYYYCCHANDFVEVNWNICRFSKWQIFSISDVPNFCFIIFFLKMKIMQNFIHVWLFKKEKQLKTKTFYRKFCLEQSFLKVHYFDKLYIIKSVMSKNLIKFFVSKFSFIVIPRTCKVWFP